MKKYKLNILAFISFFAIISFSFIEKSDGQNLSSSDNENGFAIPAEVKTILDNSCLRCHGTDGKGKAKIKWNYTKMTRVSKAKLVSKLSKIESKVNDDKMPPPKFLKKHPEHKLNEADKKTLTDWASGLAEKLTNQ